MSIQYRAVTYAASETFCELSITVVTTKTSVCQSNSWCADC